MGEHGAPVQSSCPRISPMTRYRARFLVFPALLCSAWLATSARAQTPPPDTSVPTLEAVTVSGEQPGPGLWRATRDGHTLLILGTLTPLPRKMTWKTDEIDEALAHAGALLMPPHVEIKPNTGFFGRLALLPSLIGVRNAPDGATLKSSVPADVYTRWLAVKARYIGNDRGVERYRPIFAAIELYKDAVKKSGLARSGDITRTVAALAKKHGVAQVDVTYTLLVNDPRAAIKAFKRSTLDDVSCFTQSIDNIDAQLADMAARANAWATGDVAALRDDRRAKQRLTCLNAVTEGGVAQRIGLADVPEAIRARWLAAVDAAVAANAQAVAIVSIDDLLGAHGYLQALEERGYAVESPDGGE